VVHLFSSLLLWEKDSVDVWENTTGSDGRAAEKLVELLVVTDSELDVTWHNAAALVVAGGVTGEFKNFGAQVLKDSGHVDWGTTSDTFAESTLLQVTSDTSDWELKSGLCRAGSALSLFLSASTFSFS